MSVSSTIVRAPVGGVGIDYRILGPLEVAPNRQPAELGRPKQRALLALLLLHANQPVPLDRVVDLLWGPDAPARASSDLQVHVSRLRRTLEPSRPTRAPSQVLLNVAGGYLLRVGPDDLDANRFEALADRGHRLLAAGFPDQARLALTEALDLWRGPALAEFAYEPFAQADAARLEERRIVASEDRFEAELTVGNHAGAVSGLEALVAHNDLRERSWGLLMLALYRSGRQGEALRAFGRARAALEELGVEPGNDIRRLEADILAQAPRLDWRPRPVDGDPVVTGARADLGRLADPDGAARVGGQLALVGREAELAVLRRAVLDACEGRGRLVLLAGEAGIGKTRLASETAAVACTHGAWTAWGRGTEAERAPPSWFWSQIIRALLAMGDAEELGRALGSGAADIAQIVPEVAEFADDVGRPWPAEPAAARYRMYEAVVGFLSRLAARRPLVLVLDDLHWADVPTLELTELLAQRLADLPILMIVTYRDREAAAAAAMPTVAALARCAVLDRLPLGGLSEGEVGAFVAQAIGEEAPADVVAIVHARSDGNPFFVTELVRSLATGGAVADRVASVRQVPQGIRDVLRNRLATLPPATRTLLTTAAVAGREFALPVVAVADDLEVGDAIEIVEPAIVGGLVDGDDKIPGRYRFSHALVRDAIYEEIGGLRQARLHARVGQALSDRDDGSLWYGTQLAHHLALAAPVIGPAPGIGASIRASAAAVAALAYEQAEAHLRQALDLVTVMPRGPERDRQELQLQVRLGFHLARTRGHTWPGAGQAFDRAQHLCVEAGMTADHLRTLWGQYMVGYMSGDLEAAARIGERLLDLGRRAGDPRCELAGLIAVGTSGFYLGRLAQARTHLSGAAAISDELADPSLVNLFQQDPRLCSRNVLLNTTWLLGRYDEADALVAAQIERLETVDHDPTRLMVLLAHGWYRFLQRDHVRLADHALHLRDLAAKIGFRPVVLAAEMHRGWAMAQQGDTHAGASLMRRSLAALDEARVVALRPCFLGMLAEAELLDGLPESALATVDAALAEVTRRGDRFYLPELHRLKGEMFLAPGLPASGPHSRALARACFDQALAEAEAQGAVPFRDRAADSLDRRTLTA